MEIDNNAESLCLSLPLSGDWLACYLLLMHAPLSLSHSLYLPPARALGRSLSLFLTISRSLLPSLFQSFSQSDSSLNSVSAPLLQHTRPPSSVDCPFCLPATNFFSFFRFWSGGVRESLRGRRMNEHLFTAGLPCAVVPSLLSPSSV